MTLNSLTLKPTPDGRAPRKSWRLPAKLIVIVIAESSDTYLLSTPVLVRRLGWISLFKNCYRVHRLRNRFTTMDARLGLLRSVKAS